MIPVMAYVAFRSPRVQAYLINQLVTVASKELGTKVEVGGININIFLNIIIEEVVIYDQHDNKMLSSGRLVFAMNNFSYREKTITFDKLLLDRTFLNVVRYKDEEEFNYQFLIDHLSAEEPPDSLPPFTWKVIFQSFEFNRSGFLFSDENEIIIVPGFNSSEVAVIDFNLFISDIAYNNDTLNLDLRHFSLAERGGFKLENISAKLEISPTLVQVNNFKLVTPHTDISFDAALAFSDFGSFDNFIDKVDMRINIKPSRVSVSDMAFFHKPLSGINDIVSLEGSFAGRVANIRARSINLNIGNHTFFNGNISLNGLPDFEETFINVSISDFKTSVRDIKKYYNPLTDYNPDMALPAAVDNVGRIAFTGNFTGFIYDFVAYGNMKTDVGTLASDIVIRSIPGDKKLAYKGELSATNLNVGKLLDQEENIGLLTFSANLNGSGVDINDISVEILSELKSADVLGYNYKNIELIGKLENRQFDGSFEINDENINLAFNGMVEYQDTIQNLDFSLDLKRVNLTNINLYQRDSIAQSILSSNINMRFSFVNMENGEGDVYITNTRYFETCIDSLGILEEVNISSIVASSRNNGQNSRKISVISDVIDLSLDGSFSLDGLEHAFISFVHYYMPSWIEDDQLADDHNNAGQAFTFDVEFKNTTELFNVFLPEIAILPETHFEGSFVGDEHDFIINGSSPFLQAYGNVIRNWDVSSGKKNGRFEFEFNGERVLLTDSIWIDNFIMHGGLYDDTLSYKFYWDNKRFTNTTKGDIQGYAAFERIDNFKLKFHPSQFIVNDSVWNISQDNFIVVDSSDFRIDNFVVYKGNEYLSIDGLVSHKAGNQLKLSFNEFDIYNLDLLLKDMKVDFDGIISGELSLKDIYGAMSIVADVRIKDFGFNNDHLGDLVFTSIWDSEQRGLAIDGRIIYFGNVGSNVPLTVKGYLYPEAEDDNFDIDINIINLRVSAFGRYLESFASNVRGLGTGTLRLAGPFAKPELSGNVRLNRTGMRVNYTNVPYSFSHELEIGPQFFRFENLEIFDSIGNSGIASGLVKHNNFKDFELDISIRPNRMIILNTRPTLDEMFYGRAFATGIAQLQGPANDISFNVSARTNRGTQLFLPVEYTGEVRETQFITFIEKDTVADITPVADYKAPAGLTLDFDLEITPDAEVQIIFDSQIGDIIRGRGSGNITMEINSQGEFAMYGDYTIQEGDYLFTLQNLINKRFRIEQGGVIRWTGDPFDAAVDLTALYRVRTSLYSLMVAVDSSDVYKRRVPVDVVLNIGETLFNPSITFDIELPGSDDATREAVEREIATEQQMNQQVFSLLVLSSFMPPQGQLPDLGQGVGFTSSELLSNQLSNWLSQISSEVDIGFNYRPGDEISPQEFEMALSTQLFDDRVIIDGNVGVAGESEATTQRASNIIGDVNVEVKVTPEGRFRLKAFNRSNTSDVLMQNAPYTQGVGVFYRKEFDSFEELFKRRNRTTMQELFDADDLEILQQDAVNDEKEEEEEESPEN